MKTKIMIASSILVLASTAAFAEDKQLDLYTSDGIVFNDNDGVKTTSFGGRFGMNFNKNLAIEIEGGAGIKTDKIGNSKYKHVGDLGLYAVGKMPVTENLELLGRVGYHHVWDQIQTGAVKLKSNDGSFAVGIGAQYMFDEKNGLRIDYTRLTENDGMNNYAVSYVRKF